MLEGLKEDPNARSTFPLGMLNRNEWAAAAARDQNAERSGLTSSVGPTRTARNHGGPLYLRVCV